VTNEEFLIASDSYFESKKRANGWAADEKSLIILDNVKSNVLGVQTFCKLEC
jgi:hypothetical protein